MGNICASEAQKDQERQNARIAAQIAADEEIKRNTVKLLLLGAGESGKSTLVKQMKIIHGDGYTHEELQSFKGIICDNLVTSMRAVLEAMGILQIDLGSTKNRMHVVHILKFNPSQVVNGILPPDVAEAVKQLWEDTGVQKAYRRRNEFQLNDSAAYYFSNIDRVATQSYIPTQQDVLRARVMTTGIIETSFKFGSKTYRMFDVGGQRSERRKWIDCFDDVTAVIFVAALSGYDLKCFEDSDKNRVLESLELFGQISKNIFFKDSAMILFLNKTDLFEEKIPQVPLKSTFPDYAGDGCPENDPIAAREFLLRKFQAQLVDPRNPDRATKKIYHHFTCATDTSNIRVVFQSVSDKIAGNILDDIGIE